LVCGDGLKDFEFGFKLFLGGNEFYLEKEDLVEHCYFDIRKVSFVCLLRI
jgi:hypothetical protein